MGLVHSRKMKFRQNNGLYVNKKHQKLVKFVKVFEISLPEVCNLVKDYYTFLFASKSLISVYLQN